jgi:uncharacterized protein (TIGR00369 family)
MEKSWNDRLIELFREAPVAKLLGMSLSYDEKGVACVDLPYNPSLDHAMKGVHGGVLATMLDSAGWFAVASLHEGVWVATSEFKVHLLNPVRENGIRAEGWVVKSGKRISVAEMRVMDYGGELVAVGTGTFVALRTLPFGRNAT